MPKKIYVTSGDDGGETRNDGIFGLLLYDPGRLPRSTFRLSLAFRNAMCASSIARRPGLRLLAAESVVSSRFLLERSCLLQPLNDDEVDGRLYGRFSGTWSAERGPGE